MDKSGYQKNTLHETGILHVQTFIANYLQHNKNRLQLLSTNDIKNAMIKTNTNTFTEFFQSDHASEFSSLVEEELLKFALDRVHFVVNEAITKAISEVQNSGHPIYKVKKNKAFDQPAKRPYHALTMLTISKKNCPNHKKFTTKTPLSTTTPALVLPTPIVCEPPHISVDAPHTPCSTQQPHTPIIRRQLRSSSAQQVCPTKTPQSNLTSRTPRRVSETSLYLRKTRQPKRRHTIDI